MLRIGVGVLCGLLLAGPCSAGVPTRHYLIGAGLHGSLAAEKGKLRLISDSSLGSVGDSEDAWDRWYIEGTRIKSSTGGGYLAYDPEGKDPRVRLVARPGPGTEWSVAALGQHSEGKRAVIQAAKGPYRGWLLTFEVQKEEGKDGRAISVLRILLAEQPTVRLKAERIFAHK